MKTTLLLSMCSLALVLPGCAGGRDLDLGDGAGEREGTGANGAENGAASPGTPTLGRAEAATADTLARRCLAADAFAQELPSTPQALTAKLARRWYRCSTPDVPTSLYRREAAIEFTVDGTFQLLRRVGDGFEPFTGEDVAGSWAVAGPKTDFAPRDATPGTYGAIVPRYAGTYFRDGVKFSPDDTQLHVLEMQTNEGLQTKFVHLDP